MSGIVGIINFDKKPVEKSHIDQMLSAIAHRGPDGREVWVKNNASLGFIKLETGNVGPQPFVLDDRIAVVLDGAIYNRDELREKLEKEGVKFYGESDSELLAHLYRVFEERCLDRINGMFSLAIRDEAKDILLLARDRIGMKSCYYYSGPDYFAFGSEVKALLELPGVNAELYSPALIEYCTYQNILTEKTLFKGIKKVKPACYLTITKGKIEKNRYWQPNLTKVDLGNEGKYIAGFQDLFPKAVKRTIPGVSFGSFLSGGFDSTSVAAIAKQYSETPLDTFCGYYPEGEAFDESAIAEEVSERIGSAFHKVPIIPADYLRVIDKVIYHLEEPTTGSAAFAYYLVSGKAAEKVKVMLTGHGGDELFGGYPAYKVAWFKERIKSNPFEIFRIFREIKGWEWAKILYFWIYPIFQPNVRHGLYTMFPDSAQKQLFQPEFIHAATELEPPTASAELIENDKLPLDDQILYLYLSGYLPTLVSVEDKMEMAHGIEPRMPICDLEMLEFATTIPMRYKVVKGEYKYIEKTAMRPYLPEILYHQPKKGFPTPFARWYRNELKEYVKEVLLEKRYLPPEIFNYDYLEKFLNRFWSGNGEGLRDYEKATKIYSLITIALWFKIFIKNSEK
jgi:asparagine synthase (glutamine-hydrolysing)